MFKKVSNTVFLRFHSAKVLKDDVLIAAAVRTPFVKYDTLRSNQLATLVVDEVIKRAAIPRDDVQHLFINSSYDVADVDGTAVAVGLKNCEAHTLNDQHRSAGLLLRAFEALQTQNATSVILGDVHNNLNDSGQITDGNFAAETVPIHIRQSHEHLIFESDDANPAESKVGAAALALVTESTAQRLELNPLARFVDFEVAGKSRDAIKKLLQRQNITKEQVAVWQIQSTDTIQGSTAHLITHIIHSLPIGELACVVFEQEADCVALLIEKLTPIPAGSEGLPLLTLYTKSDCPLCDMLVAELEEHFRGEYQLQNIYIDRKENVRFLKLFRYDIPVLFLNGQFLCMHKLNVNLLRYKLDLLKVE